MTQNSPPIRAQLITPFVIFTLFMLVAWTLTQWHFLDQMIQSQRGRFVGHLQQEWRLRIQAITEAQTKLLQQIATDKDIQQAFRQRNRKRLLEQAQALSDYARRGLGFSHFYFHLPDKTNFLRVYQPKHYGDTINRQTLENTITSQSIASGIEIGYYGRPLIRTVYPWKINNQIIGYIELGTSFQSVLDSLGKTEQVSLSVIINKSLINKARWQKYSPNHTLEQWQQYSDHLLEAYNRTLPDTNLTPYFTPYNKALSFDKDEISRLKSHVPITDVNNRVIGHLLIEKDFKWLVDEFSELFRTIILAFLVLIALIALLYTYFARRLQNQLEFTYRALNTEIESRISAEKDLLEHQKTLEQTVANRTEELRQANQELKEDIELRRQTERQLAQSTQKYRALFNGSTDMILVLRDNALVDANVSAHNALDINDLSEHNKISLDKILTNTSSPQSKPHQWLREAQENGVYRAEMTFEGNRQKFPVDVVITYINEDNSSLYLVACRDISERKAALAKVEYQALYDPLTDLPNRRLFMEELQRATQLCRRQNQKGAILFIDLDHFKNINDTLGHSVGDLLLEKVATRLKQCMRAEDTVARFGGDEFVVILPCCGENNESAAISAHATAEKISGALVESYVIGEHHLHVTPSIGIAIFPKLNENSEDILKQADAALYGAKGAGRNTIRFFEPKMQQANEERLLIEKELRNAINRDQLFINLQTKHDADGNVIGSECLLRWKHPDLGMVSPFHFISIAEETGFITQIGHWVVDQVGQWINYSLNHNLPAPYSKVAVNLSPLQLFQPSFVNDLWATIQKYNVPPELITLEITENVLIKDFDSVVRLLQKLKDLGFMISVDDFGTGYSSLRYLKNLPIDELKIDQSFVRDIHTNANDRAIADTIISMARHLELNVVAEGVENIEQFSLLKQQGCDRFQGYYFARPITTGELLDKIKASA